MTNLMLSRLLRKLTLRGDPKLFLTMKQQVSLRNTKSEIFQAFLENKDALEERNVLVIISIILFSFVCLT